MKGLLLLNFNNTVWHFCLSKRKSKGIDKRHVKRVKIFQEGGQQVTYMYQKMGQKGGQKGSRILP